MRQCALLLALLLGTAVAVQAQGVRPATGNLKAPGVMGSNTKTEPKGLFGNGLRPFWRNSTTATSKTGFRPWWQQSSRTTAAAQKPLWQRMFNR